MPARIVERHHGTVLISTDPTRVDVAAAHAFLTDSYWAEGRSFATQQRAIEHSHLGAGGDDEQDLQVGVARMVTDLATNAWLGDVYVLPESGGTDLGVELVRTIVEHPDVAGVRWQFPATADAHDRSARFGFEPLAEPEHWKHRRGSI